jgi:hypothetical protein
MVPLFLRDNQTFVKGADLKEDFAKLNTYYSGFPDDLKMQGAIRFAPYPPIDGSYLVSALWDKYLPVWRKHQAERSNEPVGELEKVPKELMEKIRRFKEEATPVDPSVEIDSGTADHVGFERRASMYKGNWRRFPPEIEAEAQSD